MTAGITLKRIAVEDGQTKEVFYWRNGLETGAERQKYPPESSTASALSISAYTLTVEKVHIYSIYHTQKVPREQCVCVLFYRCSSLFASIQI